MAEVTIHPEADAEYEHALGWYLNRSPLVTAFLDLEVLTPRRWERSAVTHYKVPLVFEPQPEGGFTVTSPLLPELLTEGDSVEDALDIVRDALAAVLELYQDLGKPLPDGLTIACSDAAVHFEILVAVP